MKEGVMKRHAAKGGVKWKNAMAWSLGLGVVTTHAVAWGIVRWGTPSTFLGSYSASVQVDPGNGEPLWLSATFDDAGAWRGGGYGFFVESSGGQGQSISMDELTEQSAQFPRWSHCARIGDEIISLLANQAAATNSTTGNLPRIVKVPTSAGYTSSLVLSAAQGGPVIALEEEVVGWPIPSVWRACMWTLGSGQSYRYMGSPAMVLGETQAVDERSVKVMPLQPAGIGFLICAMFWSAVWFGPVTAIGWGRRIRRRARGQCEQCGYDLRGNASGVCPECGELLAGKREGLGAETNHDSRERLLNQTLPHSGHSTESCARLRQS